MIEVRPFTTEERDEIYSLIEDYHAVFSAFVNISSIKFSNRYPTAWVEFNKGSSKPNLFFNEEFWSKLSDREKVFVLCHECLHIFLDHGNRRGQHLKGATPRLINFAQDIAINEMIAGHFGIDKQELRDWKNYCWIETCFPQDHHKIQRNREFTYYLEKLIENEKNVPNLDTVDHHGDAAGDGDGNSSERSADDGGDLDQEKLDAAKRLSEELTPNELDDLIERMKQGGKEAGNAASAYQAVLNDKVKPAVLDISRLINKLKASRFKYSEGYSESFQQVDRRLQGVSRELVIPGTISYDKPEKKKLLTAFFMDVSGSCMEFFHTFERIVAAFNKETETFELRTYCFDTSVQEINKNTKLYVGGGTAFNIIERKVLELETEYKHYPDCVVVLTDGYGNQVLPKIPKRWIWLLTDNHTKEYVPRASRSFIASQVVI